MNLDAQENKIPTKKSTMEEEEKKEELISLNMTK